MPTRCRAFRVCWMLDDWPWNARVSGKWEHNASETIFYLQDDKPVARRGPASRLRVVLERGITQLEAHAFTIGTQPFGERLVIYSNHVVSLNDSNKIQLRDVRSDSVINESFAEGSLGIETWINTFKVHHQKPCQSWKVSYEMQHLACFQTKSKSYWKHNLKPTCHLKVTARAKKEEAWQW